MKNKYGIQFTKAVGSGNDFIIIENKDGLLDGRDLDYSAMAQDLCRRHMSVGADGILVLENAEGYDFKMRIINPDGSEVDMCGNGARCSATYAASKGWGNDLTFLTRAGAIQASVNGDIVKLRMSDPKDIRMNVDISLKGIQDTIHFLNTGVPHVVKFVDDIDAYPVKEDGRMLREHEYFSPDGTNVNFIGSGDGKEIRVRTYERGVEDETLACGTGTVASAVVLGILGKVSSPVSLRTSSGEMLSVHYKISGEEVTEVYLEGVAKIIYDGRV